MSFYSPSVKKNIKFITLNIIWVCVIGYFIFHVISGARGAVSWAKLSKDVELLEKEEMSLKEDNAFMENKIKLLRSDNLDLDLLEEQAQSILGFTNENDVVVLLPRY